MKTLLPSDSAWIAPAVMKDFHLGMVERLVEVLRRRARLMELAAPPPSAPAPSSGPAPLTPAQRARQLTVAELRAAETRPPSPPRPAPPPQPRNLVERQKRSVALVLHKWIKQHRFLKAVPVAQGHPSSYPVVLLFLWEVESWETTPFSSGRPVWTPVLFHQGFEGCRLSGHRAACMADL